jgi:hypothetical protein
VFKSVVGFPPLVVFELVTRLLPYQHRLLYLPIFQNPQHVHANKGLVCSSFFSWI